MTMKPILTILALSVAACAGAAEYVGRLEVEAGVLSTRDMKISGYQQGDATRGWGKSTETFRLEYWRVKEGDWNYGLVLQPLSVSYADTLKADFSAKGKNFNAGDAATMDYQFHTVRFSANKPFFGESKDGSLRLGGSLLARYAEVTFSGSGQSFTDDHFLVIPVFNVEATRRLGHDLEFVTRSDFLPGYRGNVFLDGLFDVYFGLRRKVGETSRVDAGVRLFFGGYDPRRAGDYANRIFFNSLVLRYVY
jgi:hypothetical protein